MSRLQLRVQGCEDRLIHATDYFLRFFMSRCPRLRWCSHQKNILEPLVDKLIDKSLSKILRKITPGVPIVTKGRVPEKSCCSFGFCPNYLPPPQFGQLVQLFLNAKNVDLRDIQNYSKILLIKRENTSFVGHVYNLKNSLKFKLLAFWREIDSFSWPKMH